MSSPTEQLENTAIREPIQLNQPGIAWVIEAGYADLFIARMRASGDLGARTPVARIEAGNAFFGFDTLLNGWTIIAQPGSAASIARLDREYLTDAARLVEDWVLCLSAAALGGAEPRQYQIVEPGCAIEIPLDPQPVSGKNPVVWVSHVRGKGRLLGKPELTIDGQGMFPLARPAWLEEQPRNIIAAASTEEAFASGQAWPGVDCFHGIVWQALIQDLEEAELKEKTRLARTRDTDAAGVDQSIRRLARPLASAGRRALPDDGHPLVRACEAIGRFEQITFLPPPEALRGLAMRDPVRAICLSSGVRSRRVVLGESWYRREGRALLAFRESDQRPMALIPRGSRRYEVFDPVEDTHTRVNEEVAAALRPYAFTFYRPFHARPVSLRYLMLFGLRGTWGEVTLVLLLGLAVGALGMTMPLLIANVFDTIIPGAERQHMVEAALFLFAALLASTMLGLTRGFTFLRIENRVEARVQAALFDRLLTLPAQFFRHFSSAELAQRAAAIGNIRRMLTNSAISAVFAGVFSFFSFALLFWFSRKLAMIATALTAVQLAACAIAALSLWRVQGRSVEAQTRTSGVARRVIGGIPKIRVAGAERRAFTVWSKAAAENWALAVKTSRISGALSVFNIAFPLAGFAAIFYAAGHLITQTGAFSISTGRFVAFLLAYGSFSGALTQLVQAAIGLLAIVPVYESARPILDAVPETDPSKPPAGELTGRIELSHIYFRYRKDGHLVLKDISLNIKPGEFVAFVGPSGSGKSTIFRILLGFERPESGTVFFDGQDITTLDVASVRQQMGIVLQNSTVFNGDIFQNIVRAGPFTLDQAWEAACMAGLDKDIRTMPMGIYTMVGDGGAGLSGGQRQRLMIARAIVGRPRILLFDEATSALDNQTQAVISRSLDQMRATRVVIAHRLTTVMKADRIFVVEKGEIVQAGTYEELMKQPGAFAELAKRQLT